MKNIIQKTLSLLLCGAILLSLAACGSNSGLHEEESEIKIVCTIFPQYDFLRNIIGSDDGLILLAKSGEDMHSYQPTAKDIVEISKADLFVTVGGGSDNWVEAALESSGNENLVVFEMMSVIETLYAPLEEHEHDHEHDHGEECEADEHIWLSLKNAAVITQKLCDILCEADPVNAEKYAANTASYIAKLNELDGAFSKAVETAERKTVLFADRFPFIYLMKDYGIEYHAAFSGCSSETEASFETISTLTKTVEELSLPCVFIIDGSDGALAQTVTRTNGAKILTLDSCQSVSLREAEDGVNYIEIMAQNLTLLQI
ncbi:MAG: zinc ABC transporter substrate-binding protein, partial [Clostridia bacterium]|nr:zinc ABC transporter substrate-binding protein [Clostridia bacterium]